LNVKPAGLALVPIFYVDRLTPSMFTLAIEAITLRAARVRRGQAAMIAARSASFCGFTDKAGDKEFGGVSEVLLIASVGFFVKGL